MTRRHIFPLAVVLAASLLASSAALANWTASGRFLYQDRSYDQTGFTGPTPSLAIRYADVHIVDSKNKIVGSGTTDAAGNFSFTVIDSSTRTVYARASTRSQP